MNNFEMFLLPPTFALPMASDLCSLHFFSMAGIIAFIAVPVLISHGSSPRCAIVIKKQCILLAGVMVLQCVRHTLSKKNFRELSRGRKSDCSRDAISIRMKRKVLRYARESERHSRIYSLLLSARHGKISG